MPDQDTTKSYELRYLTNATNKNQKFTIFVDLI